MRNSNMKWLCVLFCLIVVVATPLATATILNDSEEPGSVLVFPLFETGTVTTADQGTLPRTAIEISVRCPNGSRCPDLTDVDIRAHWVCPNQICSERDFVLATTVNGTLLFDPQGNCEPAQSSNNFFDSCGSIPPPPCSEGFLVAWVVDESNRAIKFDGLIGDAVLRESPSAVTAYNAVPIQAGAGLATGALTDVNKDGKLNFNGTEYKELTNKIIGSVRFDTSTATSAVNTSLILLTLDTLSNRLNNPVFVDLNFFNELEQVNSTSTAFFCFTEQSLARLGVSTTFGTKGLIESTRAIKTAFVGGDKVGPVTLLGLVITRESSAGTLLRDYAYPLFDNSIPLATAFAP